MFNKKDFEKIRKELDKYDEQREEAIKKSRGVVKLSKKCIYSVHRDEFKKAEEQIKEMLKSFKETKKIVEKNAKLFYSGFFKNACQELVEAICFFNVIKNQKLPSSDEFGFEIDYYLMGLSDLTGELVRKGINYSLDGHHEKAMQLKKSVEQIYNHLQTLDIGNGEVRKKRDKIKYDLQRLEDLAIQIKFKDGKIKTSNNYST